MCAQLDTIAVRATNVAYTQYGSALMTARDTTARTTNGDGDGDGDRDRDTDNVREQGHAERWQWR